MLSKARWSVVLVAVVLAAPGVAQAQDRLERVSPGPITFTPGIDFREMAGDGAGDVTAPVWAVDIDDPPLPVPQGDSGCEAADFAGMPPGSIALVQRSQPCLFRTKAQNALAAGAAGLIVFNTTADLVNGTLLTSPTDTPIPLPVVGATGAVGEALRAGVTNGATGVVARLSTDGDGITLVPVARLLSDLDASIDAAGLPAGAARSIRSKLDAARASEARGNTNATCNQLAALENHVRAQRGGSIPAVLADQILAAVTTIRARLLC